MTGVERTIFASGQLFLNWLTRLLTDALTADELTRPIASLVPREMMIKSGFSFDTELVK